MTSAELIKDIGVNKHNVKMRLRMAVLDPIDSIIHDNQVTSEFFRDHKETAQEIHKVAMNIMNFFSEKWFDSDDDSEEIKIASLRRNILKTVNEIIPQIKETIMPFYDMCYQRSYYFMQPLSNNESYNLIQESLNDYESICVALCSLEHDQEKDKTTHSEENLLELLQLGLDRTPLAIVSYVNEFSISKIAVSIDRNRFLNDVLLNIRSNIERHAYGATEYKKKLVTNKHVVVSVDSENADYIIVSIQNDGAPFRGDVKQVFDYGYTSGKSGNEGKGMFSVKKTMQELGGDAQFLSKDGRVVHKILIRK